MARDPERVRLNSAALNAHGWDAVICSFPEDVLLATGYWPVLGNAIAIMTCDGRSVVIAPEDERQLAADTRADMVCTFQPASLEWIRPIQETVHQPLRDALHHLALDRAGRKIALVLGPGVDGSGYAARFTWGAAMQSLLGFVLPRAEFADATDALLELRSVLTDPEIATLKVACATAEHAFRHVAANLRSGMSERQIAAELRLRLGHTRASAGYAYCMSGPNAARAYASWQESTDRLVAEGDVALVHCNSWHNGFWTDITRTFRIGQVTRKTEKVCAAVLAARDAALAAVRPGVTACSVDAVARAVMTDHGFGHAFRHATGHGVGYSAINHNARPRIHPRSDEVLKPGMVFNIEPAAYFESEAGVRHCEMVAVTESGVEVLTPFVSDPDTLIA